ncbi:MAG: energy-coupling factor transporter transmembrane component T family protein [Zhaonellaceae bacterium]
MNETVFAYCPKQSFLHDIDPIKKIVWLIMVGLMSMIFQTGLLQFPLFVLLALTGVLFAGLPVKNIFTSLKPIWLLAFIVLVIQSLVIKGETLLFSVGPIQIYAEGLMSATGVALRMVNVAVGSVVFLFTTHPRDLAIASTEKFKLPVRGAQGLFLALRFLPLLQDEYQDIVAAHKVRGAGGGKSLKDRFTRLQRFTVPYLFSGLRRAQITALAMDSKAFGAYPTKTYFHIVSYPKKGWLFLLAWALIGVIFAYLIVNGYIPDVTQVRFA